MKKNDRGELGPCCICQCENSSVRNILMIHKRSPYLLGGWGCVQCGLAANGATAIICDSCKDKFKDRNVLEALRFFCKPDGDGESYVRGRARISELDSQPVWEHDMSKHPEEETI